jgi:alkylated DNA nucleotide flippase Atl1
MRAPLVEWGGGVGEDYVEAVLDVVAQIPAGRAMTYGDVAAAVRVLLGRGGPRNVGFVMACYGGGVPWWRVVNAAGRVSPHGRCEALARLRAEGCPLSAGGERVNLRLARWGPWG